MSVGLMCFAASEGDSLIAIADKFPKYSTPESGADEARFKRLLREVETKYGRITQVIV